MKLARNLFVSLLMMAALGACKKAEQAPAEPTKDAKAEAAAPALRGVDMGEVERAPRERHPTPHIGVAQLADSALLGAP